MTTLFRLLSTLPLWLLHGAGSALGWLVFASSGVYRRRFIANAALAGYGFAQVRQAVGNAGRMVAELPRLWMGAPVFCDWENDGCIDRAFARGRGVIFLTPHVGSFEVAAQAMAQRFVEHHGPLTVLYRPARKPWVARLIGAARKRPGLITAPTTLAGVRQMMRALRNGQAVGLLPDQVPPEGMGLWTPFFGQPAYSMTLAARLAQQTGATVLLGWSQRLSFGRGFRLHFRELERPLAGDIESAVLQVNQEMERLIRECPTQYLWGYSRYKQPHR